MRSTDDADEGNDIRDTFLLKHGHNLAQEAHEIPLRC